MKFHKLYNESPHTTLIVNQIVDYFNEYHAQIDMAKR